MEWVNNMIMWLGLVIVDIGCNLAGESELDSWEEDLGLELQGVGHAVFNFGYAGSDAEIEDAITYSEDEWPDEHMSERQLEARRQS